jgi:hypothetical protein
VHIDDRQAGNRQLSIRNPQSTMLIIDSLLIGGLRFVLDKVAAAVDTEMNDDSALREQLLAAQMRVELGEISADEFNRLEADILARLREIRDRRQGGGAATFSPKDYTVTGVEATIEGDEHDVR